MIERTRGRRRDNDQTPQLLKPRDVATALGCSEWWVKEQARTGRIPFSWIGGSYRFTHEHLHEIITPSSTAPPSRRRQPGQSQMAQRPRGSGGRGQRRYRRTAFRREPPGGRAKQRPTGDGHTGSGPIPLDEEPALTCTFTSRGGGIRTHGLFVPKLEILVYSAGVGWSRLGWWNPRGLRPRPTLPGAAPSAPLQAENPNPLLRPHPPDEVAEAITVGSRCLQAPEARWLLALDQLGIC